MSSVNYSLKHKGVRLIDSQEAWVKGKNGVLRLNGKYRFVGKIDTRMPNMIVSASDKVKPSYKGNTCDLNTTAKKQIIDHFYNKNGKRNKKNGSVFWYRKIKNKRQVKRMANSGKPRKKWFNASERFAYHTKRANNPKSTESQKNFVKILA